MKRGEETQARKDRRPTRQGDIQTKGEPHHTGREGQQDKTHREKDRRMWRLTLIVIIIILDGLDGFSFFFTIIGPVNRPHPGLITPFPGIARMCQVSLVEPPVGTV